MKIDLSQQKSQGQRLAVLTAYTYPMARIMDDLALDFLLVGDSVGMVELGYPDTTHVTLAAMEHHVGAVARGAQRTPIVADLPFRTYESVDDALRNARRLEAAGAQSVKMEGGEVLRSQVETLVKEGIPVMGHLGMLPQHVLEEGGKYRMKGKTSAEADGIRRDALALEAAGAYAVVLELVSPPLAREITQLLTIPTIGIGSGPDCDGQVLVTHDLIGTFPWFRPSFVQAKAELADDIRRVVTDFVRETHSA